MLVFRFVLWHEWDDLGALLSTHVLLLTGLGTIFGTHELREDMDRSTEQKTIEKYLLPHLQHWYVTWLSAFVVCLLVISTCVCV